MALVSYVGDPANPVDHRDECKQFGLTFPLNEPIEVDDEKVLRKVRNNRFYEVLEDGNPGDTSPASSESAPTLGRVSRRGGKSAV